MKHETESKMSIQKFKIEKSDHNLFECLICQKNFDQYALADHYLSAHNNIKLRSVQPIRESKIFKWIPVQNHLLNLIIWQDISKPYKKGTRITNVTHVENHLLSLVFWEDTP